jgi:hypothetical protein
VDADENTVYLGQFQELLDYYREEHLGPEEEMEYVLLRNLRRTVFQLTIGEGGSLGHRINDCKSLYDIVHLAQELAGDALVELITGRRDVKKTSIEVDAGFAATLRAIFLNGAPASGQPPVRPEIHSINCLPLRTFAAGVSAFYRELGPGPPPFTVGMAMAIVNDEHANIIVIQPEGFDMVDSYMSESKESNYIYCRLSSGVHEPHLTGGRVGVAGEILSRLDFTTARTGKGVSAWISSLPRGDLEERLLGVGLLAGYLQEMDAVGWRDINVEERVENFMLHFA